MNDSQTTISTLIQEVVEFRDERGWKKHHRPKDLALSIALEAAELLEWFQWRTGKEVDDFLKNPEEKRKLSWEIADILIYIFSFADILEIDLSRAVRGKLDLNRQRFPKEKMKKLSSEKDLNKMLKEIRRVKKEYKSLQSRKT